MEATGECSSKLKLPTLIPSKHLFLPMLNSPPFPSLSTTDLYACHFFCLEPSPPCSPLSQPQLEDDFPGWASCAPQGEAPGSCRHLHLLSALPALGCPSSPLVKGSMRCWSCPCLLINPQRPTQQQCMGRCSLILVVLNKSIINTYSKSWILSLKICFKIRLKHNS